MIRYMKKFQSLFSAYLSVKEISKAKIRVIIHRNDVKPLKLSKSIRDATHVVALVVRNERTRLPFFVNFYRNMGFQHFLVVDNASDDGTCEFFLDQEDATVYRSEASFFESRFGMDWINLLLSRHCHGKWILCVDADEFICFENSDKSKINFVTEYMDNRNESSMNCLMVDMYSSRNIEENLCGEGVDPLSVCNLYDNSGYYASYSSETNTTWIKGGVRGRNYFSSCIWNGPALNKTPLVRWRRSYAFLRSAHQLWPFKLNGGSSGEGSISGALLHAKFLSDFVVKIGQEAIRGQHSDEYLAYISNLNTKSAISLDNKSTIYKDWRSLARDRLITCPHYTGFYSENSRFAVKYLENSNSINAE